MALVTEFPLGISNRTWGVSYLLGRKRRTLTLCGTQGLVWDSGTSVEVDVNIVPGGL